MIKVEYLLQLLVNSDCLSSPNRSVHNHLHNSKAVSQNLHFLRLINLLLGYLTVGIHEPVSQTHLINQSLSFAKSVSFGDSNGMASKLTDTQLGSFYLISYCLRA